MATRSTRRAGGARSPTATNRTGRRSGRRDRHPGAATGGRRARSSILVSTPWKALMSDVELGTRRGRVPAMLLPVGGIVAVIGGWWLATIVLNTSPLYLPAP